MSALDKLRGDINATDDQLLRLVAARRELIAKVIEHKAAANLPLRDPHREEELLTRLIAEGRKLGLDAHIVTRVFHEIIDDSVRMQQLYLLRAANSHQDGLKRVAFQGIEGAYSFLAAQKHFARTIDQTTFIGYPTFKEVIEALEEGRVEYAFLPIENTTAGNINEVFDLLAQSNLSIIGEEVFRVEHCLLAIEDVPLASIRRVISHPQALAQCMKFLTTLANCQIGEYTDTAMAARKVKEDQDPAQGAIASEAAARKYGLKILWRNLADQTENYTRFLLISREPIRVDPRIPAKTSLVLAVAHEEGALLHALMVFHRHKINLTKLDGSRPRQGSPFQYLFNVDFEGNIADEHVCQAIEELRGVTSFLKILGTYAVEARGKTVPSQEARVPAPARTASPAAPPPSPPAAGAPPRPPRVRLEPIVVSARTVRIGNGSRVVAAGPATVSSRAQILACAQQVKEHGGHVLRASCFRQRSTRDGAVELALGQRGVEYLAEAGRAYDLPVLTEVVDAADVVPAARLADLLEVGARNMQNLSLLKELGRVNRPVILKRGMSSTLEELLAAAAHILNHGNQQVILCERGIRTFETATRNTLDLSAVPILRQLTHLPVALDPSHAGQSRELVLALARAAFAVEPDAILLEIAPDEEAAAAGTLGVIAFSDFAGLMQAVFLPR